LPHMLRTTFEMTQLADSHHLLNTHGCFLPSLSVKPKCHGRASMAAQPHKDNVVQQLNSRTFLIDCFHMLNVPSPKPRKSTSSISPTALHEHNSITTPTAATLELTTWSVTKILHLFLRSESSAHHQWVNHTQTPPQDPSNERTHLGQLRGCPRARGVS
jgi:hypothetical protein